MVNFFNSQAHGKAKDVSERAKVRLAEWASKPDATHALFVENSVTVTNFDDTEVEMVTGAYVVFFHSEKAMNQRAEELSALKPPSGQKINVTKFEWDLGINLIP